MRLWSVHPENLDKAGLGAAWREGLLAQNVLSRLAAGEQRVGYQNHSQLERFKRLPDPLQGICDWLWGVQREAAGRGYKYNPSLIVRPPQGIRMKVTQGQLSYELGWLRRKLEKRDPGRIPSLVSTPHPMFDLVEGVVASWEKVSSERDKDPVRGAD